MTNSTIRQLKELRARLKELIDVEKRVLKVQTCGDDAGPALAELRMTLWEDTEERFCDVFEINV